MVAIGAMLALTLGACRGRTTLDPDPGVPVLADAGLAHAGSTTTPYGPVDIVQTAARPDDEAPPAPPAPPAADGGLADEIALRSAVERDQIRFLVRQKLEAARVHMRNAEYAEAETLLLQARELEPGNTAVRTELRDVQQLLGHRGAGAGGMLARHRREVQVRIDAQRTPASRYVNNAQMHMQNMRYDSAIENYESALFIIESSPFDIDWQGLRDTATRGLREARRMKEERERAEHRRAVETSLVELARQEEQELLAEQQRLERLMGSAVEAFYREDFELAESYAQQILDVQPDNTKARDLLLASGRARHDQVERDYLRREKIAFREWMDDIQATRVLQQKILKWPSQSFWDKITEARRQSQPAFGDVQVDAEAEALKEKIRATSVDLTVNEMNFDEVVRLLQIQTGINITIDPRVSEIGEAPVSGLIVEDISLETVLNLLASSSGSDTTVWITRGNVVTFTDRANVKSPLSVQIKTVADLTAGLTDFIPPTIQMVGPDNFMDDEQPLFGAEGEEPVLPYGTVDELIELVRNAVEPTFWDETEGADIRSQGEHAIVVKATADVQAKVDRFLSDLRGFAGIVVTVETRFLELGDAFLRDVGVDWRGTGGQTPGTLVNLDDVTNGLEDNASAGFDNGGGGNVTGAALNPSAGVYFNDGADGDFRGRTENIFDNSLGGVLSALGGTSLTLSYLDDTEFTAIVRATEKSAQARTLTAPTITVFNTQRANLTVVNQLSYIQDFDVEVAQTSFIADPIVGIIQDGLTLDVRPTVSNDRRYITLELQPTVADLIEPIPTFATTLASSFAPVIIQLPELRLQQARVTVRIPDKGSILIGGLKNITTVDRTSETPLVAEIPILSFLFSRKGRSDEIGHLMILVRAEITDLFEQQEQLMRGAGGDRFEGPYAVPPSPFDAPATGAPYCPSR